MKKDKKNYEVSDHEEELYEEEEKIKRSLGTCKGEAEGMVQDKVTVQNPTPTHQCNICGKSFSNGKALGGHRRSHFQAARKHQNKVKNRFTNHSETGSSHNRANCDDYYDDDIVVDDKPLACDGKFTCYLCNKEFSSKNALFGHMRSHPDRPWRGLCPPNDSHHHSFLSDSMKNIKDQDEGDCVGDVVAPYERDSPVIDLLKFTPPSWVEKDKRGKKGAMTQAAETLVYVFNAPVGKKTKIVESSPGDKPLVKSIKVYVEEVPVNMDGEGKEQARKKSEKLVLNLNEKASQHDDVDRYKHGTCGKSFSTFQGLGGHGSIHKEKKTVMTDVAVQEENNYGSSYGPVPKMDETTVNEDTSLSQCTFSKELDFDLNEPFSPED